MNSTRTLFISFGVGLFLIIAGTSGYVVIEGWSWLDALYMTMITLSTVGYGEVHDVSRVGRIFTIFLVFFGVGFTLFLAGAVMQFVVDGRLRVFLGRRRLDQQIGRLRDHYIICGYGRIGRVLCKKLRRKPIKLVIIEMNPDLIPVMEEDGILYITGNAADEAVLRKAGIEHAKMLVSILATDTDNVFLVLTARQLNPDLYIIARASREESVSKLMAAGANKVESPYNVGAVRMANSILRPTVTDFLDLAFAYKRKDIQMEELPVSPSSALVDVMLKDSGIRANHNCIIIAIKASDGNMTFNPSFENIIKSGDTLIAVGEVENLDNLEKALGPRK
jgi:voltage-gated potassium channel